MLSKLGSDENEAQNSEVVPRVVESSGSEEVAGALEVVKQDVQGHE